MQSGPTRRYRPCCAMLWPAHRQNVSGRRRRCQRRKRKCRERLSRLDWRGLAPSASTWRGGSKPAFRASFSRPSRCATRTRRGAICRDAGGRIPIIAAEALAQVCDLVVECLPPDLFRKRGDFGRSKPASFSCRCRSASFWKTGIWWRGRKQTGARILVPTGALIGLDAVRAAAEGTIHSVTMVTRKPPNGLEGAPYLVERGISLKDLKEPHENLRRQRARGRARLSRQRQRRRGAQPRRHRAGQDAARNLGRSGDRPATRTASRSTPIPRAFP